MPARRRYVCHGPSAQRQRRRRRRRRRHPSGGRACASYLPPQTRRVEAGTAGARVLGRGEDVQRGLAALRARRAQRQLVVGVAHQRKSVKHTLQGRRDDEEAARGGVLHTRSIAVVGQAGRRVIVGHGHPSRVRAVMRAVARAVVREEERSEVVTGSVRGDFSAFSRLPFRDLAVPSPPPSSTLPPFSVRLLLRCCHPLARMSIFPSIPAIPPDLLRPVHIGAVRRSRLIE